MATDMGDVLTLDGKVNVTRYCMAERKLGLQLSLPYGKEWVRMTPAYARELADLLIDAADKCEPKVT